MHCIKNECFVQRLIGYLWKVHLQSACIDTEPFITVIISPFLSFVFCVVHPHNVRFQNVRNVRFSKLPVSKRPVFTTFGFITPLLVNITKIRFKKGSFVKSILYAVYMPMN
jgi:hypothetical protein